MGQIIDLVGANFVDDAYPVIRVDSRLTDGSLALFDFSHSATGIVGVPTNGTIVPNLAYETANKIVGTGDKTSLGVRFDSTAISSSTIVFERTAKGALHGMVSVTARNQKTAGLVSTSADAGLLRSYLKNNPSRNYAVFVWAQVTRVTHATSNINDTSTYVNAGSAATNNLLGGSITNSLGVQRFALNAATGMSGSSNANDALNSMYPFFWGQTPPYQSLNAQTGKSMILYGYHLIDVVESGLTYAELNALDLKLFNEAFAAGGRFYGDTYSAPASVLP